MMLTASTLAAGDRSIIFGDNKGQRILSPQDIEKQHFDNLQRTLTELNGTTRELVARQKQAAEMLREQSRYQERMLSEVEKHTLLLKEIVRLMREAREADKATQMLEQRNSPNKNADNPNRDSGTVRYIIE
ncbi:MAG: hypothetical protein KDD76_01695 [Rickettsiales bacterium]|nr:hypothetical protein [Rickettsiales bacterium]